MAEHSIYTTGGTVQAGGGIYLARQADAELLELCQAGAFVYILTPRQMGKSSLMVRTAAQVSQVGHRAAMIDLTQLGVQVTAEQWYLGFLAIIEEQLDLTTDVVQWWQARSHLGLTQRMTQFFKEVLLAEVAEPVVIFVDEIDSTLSLDFTDDFFAAIRYLYVARAQEPVFQRLSFVLIGVATPADLIRDPKRTPFNIGQRIDLTDFTVAEARPLIAGLGLPAPAAEQVLGWLLAWTGGHPYLTQRLCGALVERQQEAWTKPEVNRLVAETFLGTMSRQDNNLQFVRDMLTRRAPDVEAVLTTYREAWRSKRVEDEEQSLTKSHLKLSGVVKREDTKLIVRNPIYRRVFDAAWVQEHLPESWWQRLKPAMPLLVTMLVATVGMAGVTAYAVTQQHEAKRQERLAQDNAQKFAAKSDEAQRLQQDAERQRDNATQEKRKAQQANLKALTALKQAEAARTAETQQRQLAEQRQLAANLARQAEAEQRQRAEIGEKDAKQQTLLAQQKTEIAFAQKLTAQAEAMRLSALLPRRVLLAIESLRLLTENNAATADADANLRAFALIPYFVRSITHQGGVSSAIFSPDGKYLATAGRDKTARIVEVATGKEIAHITHEAWVNSAILSRDGKYLATTSADKTAQIIVDAATGKEIAHIIHARIVEVATGKEIAHIIHEDQVNSAIFSPDGKYFATASDDKTARILEVATGKEIAHIIHEDQVNSAIFSPDGKYFATASDDKTARILEVATGKEVVRIIHDDRVDSAAFSPNGKYIATASRDQTARIFEVTTGKEVARITHKDWVNSAIFSPDGKYLATASTDSTARIVEVATGKEIARFTPTPRGYSLWGGSAVFSPDGKYLAISVNNEGEGTGITRIVEVATGKEIARITHENWVNSAIFSPDGKYLATASRDKTARIVEVATGKEIARITHEGEINAAVFSPDGKYLATASQDRKARIVEVATDRANVRFTFTNFTRKTSASFSPNGKYLAITNFVFNHEYVVTTIIAIATGKEVAEFTHYDRVNSPSFSPDGKYIATASPDKTAQIVEVATGKEIARFTHEDWVNSAIFSPDGKHIATASADKTARIIEVATGKEIARITHEGKINAAVFSPDGKYLATASADKTARIVEVATGKEIARITHEDKINTAVFSPDGKYLATASSDKTARIVEVATGKEIARITHEGEINAAVFSPDGKYLATGYVSRSGKYLNSDDKTARIVEVAIGKEIARITHEDKINTAVFSSDGKYLATASSDKTARIVEVATGKEIARITHEGGIYAAVFSPDGKYLATASADKTARIVEVATGKEIARITHEDKINTAVFSPDGKYLATASADKTTQISLVHPQDLLAEACRRLHRNLTRAEWRQYLGDRPYHQTCSNLPPATIEGQGTPVSQGDLSLPEQWLATLDALWHKVRG